MTPYTRVCFVLAAFCAGGLALRAADAPGAAAASAEAKSDGPPYGYHVSVELAMNEQGKPESLKIVKSDDTTAGRILEKTALAICSHSSLDPHLKNGVPVKFTARQPFFFPIEGDEGVESNNVPMPRLHQAVQPAYPPSLVAAQEVGGAILELVVDPAGKISRMTTLRASHPEVEQAARDAVAKWEFAPAQKDGSPVESRFRLAIVFEGFGKLADIKWSVPPRPSLGTWCVTKNTGQLEDSEDTANGMPAPAEPVAPSPASSK